MFNWIYSNCVLNHPHQSTKKKNSPHLYFILNIQYSYLHMGSSSSSYCVYKNMNVRCTECVVKLENYLLFIFNLIAFFDSHMHAWVKEGRNCKFSISDVACRRIFFNFFYILLFSFLSPFSNWKSFINVADQIFYSI